MLKGMGRVSQEQAKQNRKKVVETASRLFRERGIQGVSVADLMAAVELTHGGFYKQFASKEALFAEATGQAFVEFLGQLVERYPERPEDHIAARSALLDFYFSAAHRDDPGTGCPVSGLVTDVAREAPDSPVRAVYAAGIQDLARWLSTDGDEGLATLSTMVGAVLLARATSRTDLSDRVLGAARASLQGPGESTGRPS